MSFAYTLTPTSLNVLFKGRMRTINNTSPKFARAVEIIKDIPRFPDDTAVHVALMMELEEILDIRSFVARVTSGRVQIADDQVRLDGKPVTGYVVERTLALLKAGFDVTPMARFIERLQANPTADVREDMWKWLEAGNMPLTPDGKFVAFKKVRHDYLSSHDGKTLHVIGEYMSMPRAACDHNRNNTCSRGLHFCSYEYLGDYSGSSGRVLILEIDPADVVAIPTDYNLSKGRACGYTPVGEVPHEEAARFFDGSMPVYTASYVDETGATHTYTVADDTFENEGYDETCDDCGCIEDDCECWQIVRDEELAEIDAEAAAEDEAVEPTPAAWTPDEGLVATGVAWADVTQDDPGVGAVDIEVGESGLVKTDHVYNKRLIASTRKNGLYWQRFLAGDVSALSGCFFFGDTPQGINHWWSRADGQVPLTDADKSWLQGLYDAAHPSNTAWVQAMRKD